MGRYRKRPLEIEARQLTHENWPEHVCGSGCLVPDPDNPGKHILRPGHTLDAADVNGQTVSMVFCDCSDPLCQLPH